MPVVDVCPRPTCLTLLLLPFEAYWWNLTFLWPLWPLNRRSDEEVTVDNLGCLSKVNIIYTVTFAIWGCLWFDLSLTFDPLTIGDTKRSPLTFLDVGPYCQHIDDCYFCHLSLVKNLTLFLTPVTPNDPWWFIYDNNFCRWGSCWFKCTSHVTMLCNL